MEFTSIKFWVFLGVLFLLYYSIGVRYRYMILLVFNYIFLSLFGIKPVVVVTVLIVVSYVGALWINSSKRKLLFVVLVIGSGLLLKYGLYFAELFSNIFLGNSNFSLKFILPIGFSFYALKIISYLVDVYKGERPEKNILKYAVYVSFFPQITSGPIQRACAFLPQMDNAKFDYEKSRKGIMLIMLGVIQKLVIAERCNVFVNSVYSDLQTHSGIFIVIAALLYSFQIYFDFAGYSLISIGASNLLGYSVKPNFKHPYFSQSIKEFWQKWHVSFSSWLKDYVYIPLGGNRKGSKRKYLNILATFLISGIWHGQGLHYVFWGALHGFYQIVGDLTAGIREKIRRKSGIERNPSLKTGTRTIVTFFLVTFAWIFFRAEGIGQIIEIFRNLFVFNPWILIDQSLYSLGLDSKNMWVMIFGIIFFLWFEKKCEKSKMLDKFDSLPIWIRWGMYGLSFLVIILLGMYGVDYSSQSFIYQQF